MFSPVLETGGENGLSFELKGDSTLIAQYTILMKKWVDSQTPIPTLVKADGVKVARELMEKYRSPVVGTPQ